MHIQMGTFYGSFLDSALQVHAPLRTLELLKGVLKWSQNFGVQGYQDLLCSNYWLKQAVPGPLPVAVYLRVTLFPSVL